MIDTTTPRIRDSVLRQLQTIAPEADVQQIDPHAPLRESLDIDSFDFLRLLVALHDELGVEIPESDYGQLDTLDRLLAYLAARVR